MDLTCCFTGHRPEKLNVPQDKLVSALYRAIDEAIRDGFTVFVSGMARGVDIWAAEYVLSQKEAGLPLKLVCAVPFRGFQIGWAEHWQRQYAHILESADCVRYFFDSYNAASFRIRNHWMVSHSQRVIAAFNGTGGGTKNTVEFAMKDGVEIVNVL